MQVRRDMRIEEVGFTRWRCKGLARYVRSCLPLILQISEATTGVPFSRRLTQCSESSARRA